MNQTLFQQTYSRGLRLWHWCTVIITGLLLFTALVAKTFMNKIHMGSTLSEYFKQSGSALSGRQVFDAANALQTNLWNWHTKYGYVLAGLVVFRLLVELFQPKQEKMYQRIKKAFTAIRYKQSVKTGWHYLIVRFLYIAFYGLLVTISTTGVWMSFNLKPEETEQFHSIKEIHESCFIILMGFIFIHLVGVIRAERNGHKNIVSNMINGGKELKKAVVEKKQPATTMDV